MEVGSALCSMSKDRGPYQSGLWLTRKAWGFLANAPVPLSFCPYLGDPGATNDSVIQFHSAHMQVSPALGLDFSVYKKCLGLRVPWDYPQCPVGILHSGANSLGTK